MKNQLLTSLILSFGQCVLFAFAASGQQVSVKRVDDQRSSEGSSFFNRCNVELNVADNVRSARQFVRIQELKKVTDNLGNSLIDPEKAKWDYQKTGEAAIKIELFNPPRNATHIREVSGTISFFNPTDKNGGEVVIKNYSANPGKSLLPKAAPFSLVYVPDAEVETKKKDEKIEREKELSAMDDSTRMVAMELLKIADAFSSFGGELENNLHFVVKGQTNKLVALEFYTKDGKLIETNGKSISGGTDYTIFFREKPKKDWIVKVLLETPKAQKLYNFSLKDVTLP